MKGIHAYSSRAQSSQHYCLPPPNEICICCCDRSANACRSQQEVGGFISHSFSRQSSPIHPSIHQLHVCMGKGWHWQLASHRSMASVKLSQALQGAGVHRSTPVCKPKSHQLMHMHRRRSTCGGASVHGIDRTHAHCACAAWPATMIKSIALVGGLGTVRRVSEWSVLRRAH